MKWPFARRAKAAEDTAYKDAYDLRLRYGVNAEQWLEIGILAARDAGQRRQLESVRAALAETPW